jgi:2-iminobutanoate/2-iminopropanoate deaminase
MTRKSFAAPGAAAIGPYSHACAGGGLVFLSGQTPLDPATGQLAEGGIEAQTRRCFQNLFEVLRASGLTPDDVVNVQVFLVDMADFEAMNGVYRTQFAEPFPARTTIGVAALPRGARIEIAMVAQQG